MPRRVSLPYFYPSLCVRVLQRQGRAFLRPEVSRTFTFGEESGASGGQYYNEYLGNIKLNDVPVDWAAEDLSYLHKVSRRWRQSYVATATLGVGRRAGSHALELLQQQEWMDSLIVALIRARRCPPLHYLLLSEEIASSRQ